MSYNTKTGMYEGYIYKIINNVNYKIYIGQTCRTISQRWSQHKSTAKLNKNPKAIHNAINKYGIEKFNIIEINKYICDTQEKLCSTLDNMEQYYIKKYNCTVPNGYNISHGGKGCKDVFKRKVVCYDPYNKLYLYFDSIDDASIQTNTFTSNIINCCNNKIVHANNKIFKYNEDGISRNDIEKYFNSVPTIVQYDLNGCFLNRFNNTREAALYIIDLLKINNTVEILMKNISASTRGQIQSAYGFVWRKNNDKFDKYKINLSTNRNINKRSLQKIDVYDLFGNFISTFNNIHIAFLKLNLQNKQINQALRCCDGLNVMAFGYIWRYHNDSFDKYSSSIIYGNKRINKYTIDGLFIDSFFNTKEAAKSVNSTNKNAIKECCDKKRIQYKNYLWFFIDDKNQPDKTKIII